MEEIKADNSIKPQNCAWAILSLFLGIAGIISIVSRIFIIPAIFSIMAVIFGIIALVKINVGKGLLTGKNEAIAGIALGGSWIVLIAFISIAIPGLFYSRVYNNESSAITSLKLMTNVEAVWFAQDTDNNGLGDYWTYDVSCLYRALRRDNETKVALIPLDLAMADAKPARSDVFGNKDFRIADFPEATPIPYNGYYFQMMESDQNGNQYNQGKVNGIPATNGKGGFEGKFAIVAYPAIYGSTGVNTYIVNQEGTVYYNDCGSDAKKIVIRWPGNNPTATIGPSGKPWRVYS